MFDVSEQSVVEVHQRHVPADPQQPKAPRTRVESQARYAVTAASLLRRLCFAAALVVSSAPRCGFAASPPIDYFVLALSWSPTFCASEQAAGERLQCGTGRKYAFVVHGLWPQYRKGW